MLYTIYKVTVQSTIRKVTVQDTMYKGHGTKYDTQSHGVKHNMQSHGSRHEIQRSNYKAQYTKVTLFKQPLYPTLNAHISPRSVKINYSNAFEYMFNEDIIS